MEIIINAGEGVELSEALNRFIRSKLAKVDRRFGSRLTRIEVYLKDINGPKGGNDKTCTMEARPAGIRPFAVETQASDFYDAIQGAADKLDKKLDHRLGRLAHTHRAHSRDAVIGTTAFVEPRGPLVGNE